MPGSDLSQPASSTEPSSRSACITVSTLSAITSRDTNEVHALVAHRDPVGHRDRAELQRVSARGDTPSLTALANRSSDRLHGVISFRDEPTPICGLAKSSSPIPLPAASAGGGLLQTVGDVAATGLHIRRV
jgi:hypothetical protein